MSIKVRRTVYQYLENCKIVTEIGRISKIDRAESTSKAAWIDRRWTFTVEADKLQNGAGFAHIEAFTERWKECIG